MVTQWLTGNVVAAPAVGRLLAVALLIGALAGCEAAVQCDAHTVAVRIGDVELNE